MYYFHELKKYIKKYKIEMKNKFIILKYIEKMILNY